MWRWLRMTWDWENIKRTVAFMELLHFAEVIDVTQCSFPGKLNTHISWFWSESKKSLGSNFCENESLRNFSTLRALKRPDLRYLANIEVTMVGYGIHMFSERLPDSMNRLEKYSIMFSPTKPLNIKAKTLRLNDSVVELEVDTESDCDLLTWKLDCLLFPGQIE